MKNQAAILLRGLGTCRSKITALAAIFLLAVFLSSGIAAAASYRTVNLNLRGRNQSLAIYDPAPGLPRRPFQVIVTSGDVGWIGLPVDIAEGLQKNGYRTIGFNARAYLSSFTGRDSSLSEGDIPVDYRTLIGWVNSQGAGPADFVMIGLSEGAGLTVLGLSGPSPSQNCKGIIALGMPGRTTLGWRWIDFPMWITKKDPREPLADTRAFLPKLRIPVAMIHSTHDEWDSIDKANEMYSLLPGPKKFIAIDAINHRFSDRVPEVMDQIYRLLQWLQNPAVE